MKNKYRNRKTNQIVYTNFILDEKKFEPISVIKDTRMKTDEVPQKMAKPKRSYKRKIKK